MVNNFKCLSFSPFSICTSADSVFLASFCPSIYGAAFERMFTIYCLCAIIRQCRITLSLYKCTPLRFFFILLNYNYNLSTKHSVYLHVLGHHSCTPCQFLFAAREQKRPCYEPHIFTFLYKEGCYLTNKNQVTHSRVIIMIQQINVLESHFAACLKFRWQVEERER